MKRQTKFSQAEEQRHDAELGASTQTPREFASAEELLRCDAARSSAPPGLDQRIQRTLAQDGAARRPWWKILLGR